MSFGVLGSLEVRRWGRAVPISAGKHRVILAFGLLRANQSISSSELIDWLWDAPVRSARAALQQYVHRLRAIVGPTVIRTTTDGYVVKVESDRLDLHRFRTLVRQGGERAAEGRLSTASSLMRQGLSLWREDQPLVDVPSQPLQQTMIPLLVEERLQAVEEAVKLDLRLCRHRELVTELTALTLRHPLREPFWHHLMTALYRSGRPAEAIDAYARLRALIGDQLGVEPSKELQQLYHALLRQEVTPCLSSSA